MEGYLGQARHSDLGNYLLQINLTDIQPPPSAYFTRLYLLVEGVGQWLLLREEEEEAAVLKGVISTGEEEEGYSELVNVYASKALVCLPGKSEI